MNAQRVQAPALNCVAKLIQLDSGLYAVSLAGAAADDRADGLPLPTVQLCAVPEGPRRITIVDGRGHPASWLQRSDAMLFVAAPDAAAFVATVYQGANPDSSPLRLTLRRLAAAPGGASLGQGALQVVAFDAGTTPASSPPEPLGFEVVAHIRQHGDVRFADTSKVGPLGPGLWIEALTLLPVEPSLPVEYKGLAANGVETPWIACGVPCGTQGAGIPLVAFAVRQKPVSGGPLIDCEYTGHFQSGRIVGPMRNGAPCRSPAADDPLEGLELRLVAR